MKKRANTQADKQAVMVTAMFGDSVIKVRQLTLSTCGKARLSTRALQVLGLCLLAGSVAAMAASQMGVACILAFCGLGQVVLGSLRVREEQSSPHFTLGEGSGTDLPLAVPAVGARTFPLVHRHGDDYNLLFSSNMRGDIDVGSDILDLDDLVQSNLARPVAGYPDTLAYTIPRGARIRLELGETTFFIQSMAPVEEVQSGWLAGLDWNAQMFNGFSFSAHAMVLFLVFAIPPDPLVSISDRFDADSIKVKFRNMALELNQERAPEWLTKEVKQDEGMKGEAAKGESGKMGKEDAPRKPKVYTLKGPEENPNPQLARHLAKEEALKTGLLDILGSKRGGAISSIFAEHDTAIGSDAVTALGGLIGDSTGESYGIGGLGISGTGRGGDGTGRESIGFGGPLGTIGKGGQGKHGIGYGRGPRLTDRPKRDRTPLIAGRVKSRGSLSKAIIRRIIRRHLNEIRFCYQKELTTDRELNGRVVVKFTIASSGQVVSSLVDRTTLNHAPLEACVVLAVRRWLFPKPEDGGLVQVSYPFVFRSVGSE